MNKQGFTLIELLTGLVILALVLTIAYPSIHNLLNDASNTYYEDLEKTIQLAAMDFIEDNRSFLPDKVGSVEKLTIDQIIEYQEMEEIRDKNGKHCEEGYVLIEKMDTANYRYTSCLICDSYQTDKLECKK